MNRARDFLAGMEERTAFRACVFAAILVLMAATMFLLNVHTPLQMDDYDYSFSWSTGKPLAGVADVFASQAAHYRLWGGRSVVHTLAQLFLYWGKGVFNIANTAAYMLLVLELYALAKPKERRFCWTVLLVIHAALFTLVPFFGTVFLWLDGACNYLWGTVLALLPLCLARRALEKTDALSVISIPACFLAGWTNENTACGVLDKLRRGKYSQQASLSLLRQPVEQCRQMLFAFMVQAQKEGLRNVLIVHGKGRDDQSHANIIRSYLARWLEELPEVQAFCAALPHHGGSGACYVALRKSAQAKQETWEQHAKRSR